MSALCVANRRGLGPLLLSTCLACGGDAREVARVELPVQADARGLDEVETDLGYMVQVTQARYAVEELQLAVAGELHMGLRTRRWPQLIATAHAHPGHHQGGEITGELGGRFVLDFLAATELGVATLLAGEYDSVNFTLRRADPDDVGDEDLLLGHTVQLEGTARRAGQDLAFRALIDAPEARQIVGIPFAVKVRAGATGRLLLRLRTRDPLEQDTLFDGLDFAVLPADDSGSVLLDAAQTDQALVDAYELLRRTLLTHDHYEMVLDTR